MINTFLNIIKNAEESIVHSGKEDKTIKISIHDEIENVHICIEDNGLGIDQDEIDRIFNYGYTTKKSGHGFGLHISANSLAETGARINVESDGINHGAKITIIFKKG